MSVIGDFNGWRHDANPLAPAGESGVWRGFVPGVETGALYKYAIRSRASGERVEKADPYAFASEFRPRTASRVYDLDGYAWRDEEWLARRGEAQSLRAPMSVYELHPGSWRRVPDGPGRRKRSRC